MNGLRGVAELRQATNGYPGKSILAELRYAYAVAGNKTKAQQILNQLNATGQALPIAAVTFVLLGDSDQAERACQQRSSELVYLKAQSASDVLKGDARFSKLLQEIGLNQ